MEAITAPTDVLKLAVTRAGSQAAVAKMLGISQPAIHNRLKKKLQISGEDALVLERELGIPRHVSRPDLFSEEAGPASALLGANR